MEHLISVMIFLPLLGAVMHFLLGGRGKPEGGKKILFLSSTVSGIIGVVLVFLLTVTQEFRLEFDWVGAYSIKYAVYISGLNFLPILLVSIVFPCLMLFERLNNKSGMGTSNLLLVLQTALYGSVCSSDMFLTFLFWSLTVLPIYFILSIWGDDGSEKTSYRFFVSSIIANGFLLVAFLMIYFAVEPHTFSLSQLIHPEASSSVFDYDLPVVRIAFFLFLISFVLRLLVFPFYGWFTQLSQVAPITLLIAVVSCVLPVGYFLFGSLGYILFPQEMIEYSDLISAIALINIIVGSVCATGAKEFRSLLSYLALTTCGVVLLGFSSLNSLGVTGSFFQIFAFGVSLCGLGIVFGIILNRRTEDKVLSVKKTPFLALISALFICSLVGFPLLGSFIGNALIVMGNLAARSYAVILMGLGVLIVIYSLLTMFRQTYVSLDSGDTDKRLDVSRAEMKVLVPILLSIILIGIYPKPVMEIVKPAIESLVSGVR